MVYSVDDAGIGVESGADMVGDGVQATENLPSPAFKIVWLVVMVWKLVQGLFFIDFRWMKSYKQWRGGYMEELRFSMYDIILKGMNVWHGHAVGRLWHTIGVEQQRHIRNHIGFHYVPKDTLDGNWHLDAECGSFANYRASSSMQPMQEYCDDWLIFGERIFAHRYWVHSLLQLDLGVEYRGFVSKREALRYLKQQRESGYYFDVVLFHMRASGRCDFLPIDLRYPVQEILEKKYYNSLSRNNNYPHQRFIDFCCQYIHTTLYNNYVRGGEDDSDFWWGLLQDYNEVEGVIKNERRNWLFHLYQILDIAYDRMYDGGNTDLSNYK